MKKHRLLLLAILITPWLTIPLIGKQELRKYLPSVIFITLITVTLDKIGEQKKWWKFYDGISFLKSMDFFMLGPYAVSSYWMLKATYGKFPLYLVSNLFMQTIFTFFGGVRLAEKFKIFKFVKISRLQYSISTFIRALVLYGFQNIIDYSHKRSS
ncbi:hypothetical protein [Bacillus sp. FJAT-49736]|uniref:hypothetical protein n=1 Tax=Bacillus sp. FJAT-49736 TaxID=2833582 RepID=UPI001BC8CD0D|nr:hypothetical protein [Bacillus sp. FJAT-49736]MBS4175297.1 hypothetical protein [Bacillus sp. FJAT-49736]